MQNLNYSEIIQNLEKRGVMPDGPPSLDPMKLGISRIIKTFKNPKLNPNRIIIVAGTNGKGSTCATLEALLLELKQTVGLYTSPHLEETTERIRVNGNEISESMFCTSFIRVNQEVEDLKLSHFEMLTLMAFHIFLSGEFFPQLDWCIFEVGLGGTWDATNAIPHQYCVITTLGLDHQNLLGNSIEEIALNKFGIISPESTVVYAPLPPSVEILADQIKQNTRSKWIPAFPFELEVSQQGVCADFYIQTQWGKAQLKLPGIRAAQNTATALTLIHALGFNPTEALPGINNVRWPGRMEKVNFHKSPCPIYLSGDHNPQGIQSLISLLEYYSYKHLYILCGIGKDKDLNGILLPLFDLTNSSIFLTETPFKGRKIEEYGEWINKSQGFNKSPIDALKKIIELANKDDLVLITGSLYLVGLIRKYLKSQPLSKLL